MLNCSCKVGDMISFRALNPKIHFADAKNITLKEDPDSEIGYSILHQIPKEILLLIINQQLGLSKEFSHFI